MKKMITKALFRIFFAGMLVTLTLNFCLQVFMDMKEFQQVSAEHFWQIENIVEEKEEDLVRIKEDFAEKCIIRARAAAYIVENDPSVIEDREECRLVASLLQVDELHFFNPEGVIYAGTHPEYYGYNVDSGVQMNFFAPMLTDHSLELCQEITPNTAEGKMMQYAAVWCPDGKEIVQVGLEPARVLEAIEGNNVSDVFSMISSEQGTVFFGIDISTGEVVGSTEPAYIGKNAAEEGFDVEEVSEELTCGFEEIDGERRYCVARRAGELILIKTCPPCELFAGIGENTLQLCLYFTILFLLLTWVIYNFLERKIIRSIVGINEKLKMIEQGKCEVVLSENSTEEFAKLCHYINSMVESLLNFSGKISKALEMSEVPIGICEYEPEFNRLTATSRVKDILMLTDAEYSRFMEHPELIEQKNQGIFCRETDLGAHAYSLEKDRNHFVRVEVFTYQKSRIIVLIDITADVWEKREIAIERDTDMLTGLYNRRAFYHSMDRVFGDAEMRRDGVLAMIDLDHLKMVNDVYGHADGDRYILAFSELLHRSESDKKIAARMGGDEFVLFVYGFDGEEAAAKVLGELLTSRDEQRVLMENGEEIHLEFSIGWTFCPREEADYQTQLALADQRMYEDKKRRKEMKQAGGSRESF